MSINVREMIEALSALPPEASLVVTESGYYSYSELAEIFLPEEYTMVDGSVVYRIGHSHQSY
ncbi:hypothetical protein UFOVP242_216 [uncultured Caudovirales phage]|uniref:Uncharacterized protein n=1 Tax=uncultured Caudovirales phage TaxID=2100421 RepID=A0A6J7WZ51_9CAUD|nr:hypothetical protein UFOVP242_216 [uncultured Caudovirales phage]